MADPFLLVIDEGTTSTRAMLFGADGTCRGCEQRSLAQSHPRPGWVEHDPEEIWRSSLACARAMVAAAGGADRIAALGIVNQRETIVFWSRRTGESLAPAIVWQDRRTAALCRRLQEEGREPGLQERTGLLLSPYFSASKIAWALEHWPQLAEAGDDLLVGTVDSWLVWRLTGGLHISDASNASRTLLMDIRTGLWDAEAVDLFGVPPGALPEIVDNAGSYGTTRPEWFGAPIPISGLAGDQQAAAIGQACLDPGDVKATYGTGAFVLANIGAHPRRSGQRLLTTVLWRIGGSTVYALEGSVFVAGSLIAWLRDSLGLLESSAESAAVARSVDSNGGVYVVPGLAGLGAPWWEPEARGAILGLGFGSQRAHLVRAALEAMAHQTHDLQAAFAKDGAEWRRLGIDGGMAANDWVAQDLADLLDLPVERPRLIETTALGAAMLAGVGCGLFSSLGEAQGLRGDADSFAPAMTQAERDRRMTGWRCAVGGVLAAVPERPPVSARS